MLIQALCTLQHSVAAIKLAPGLSPSSWFGKHMDRLRPKDLESDQKMSNEWTHGFCALPPCSLVCESCLCPCLVFGRTHERSKGNLEPQSVNLACLCYTVGCITGFFPLILCIERRRIRKQYNIQGGVCGDCWGSACCVGNVLIQSELETIARTRTAPPQAYQTVEGMRYAAQ